MTRTQSGLALLLGLLMVVLSAEESSSVPMLEVRGATVEQARMVESAVGQFRDSGLRLPPVVIEFVGPNLDSCGGSRARAHLDRDPYVVSVCWGGPYVLLHELAHIWTYRVVSAEQQTAFIEARADVRAWANPSDNWENQGREHAANVIAWGLSEVPRVVSRTYPNDRESLAAAFTGLTGTQPVHASGGEPVLIDRSAFGAQSMTPTEFGR